MRHPHPFRHLRRNVHASMFDGVCFSLMVGLGETYLPAFIIAVGLGQITSGLIATVPFLAGALFQLLTPTMVKLFRSYQKWVIICATLQGCAFVPLVIAAVVGYLPAPAAFLIAALYWGAGLGIGSTWNAWISTLLPPRSRTSFFAKRNRFIHGASLVGFLVGGMVLHSHLEWSKKTWPFALLFAIAFLCRLMSVFWLFRHSEPLPPSVREMKTIALPEFLVGLFKNSKEKSKKKNAGMKFLLYMLSVQLAVNMCSPFFTPFMLTHLKLDYVSYAVLIAASFLAKMLVIPFFASRIRTQGVWPVLCFGAVGIVLNPVFWLFSSNFAYLILVQALSGVFWAAFELTSVLVVMEETSEHERVALLTNYNALNAIAMTVGSLLGATMLDGLGKTTSAYYILFVLSVGARALTLLLLKRVTPLQLKLTLPTNSVVLDLRHLDRFVSPFQEWARTWTSKRRKLRKPPSRPAA